MDAPRIRRIRVLARFRFARGFAAHERPPLQDSRKYLGEEATNEDRLAALKEECAVKKDEGHHAPIGFGA